MHRTILVFDVEGFNDGRRLTEDQQTVRDGYYEVLQGTLNELGIEWDSCVYEDRGDGLFILAPEGAGNAVFCDRFPPRLAARLHEYNRRHRSAAIIRLRMALNAGNVNVDDHGITSSALNHTFRLVNAERFRSLLRSSTGCLAIITSEWFYGDVIRENSRFRPHTYQPIRIKEKETNTIGWVALPDAIHLADQDTAECWRVRILGRDSRAHGAGVLLNGRYIITSASAVQRSLTCRVSDHPADQVLFDLPLRPDTETRRAQTVWRAAAADPESGVAALSVVGPAIRGIDQPVLQDGGLEEVDIVRVRRFEPSGMDPGEITAWGGLPKYGENGHGPIVLDQIVPYGPQITEDCHGAGVTDPQTGAIVGVTVPIRRDGRHADTGMIPMDSIASQWPLLGHIMAAQRLPEGQPETTSSIAPPQWHGNGTRVYRLGHNDLLQLLEHGMEVPELAQSASRHQIASHLPPQISLTAPRSSVDRADLAGLLWTCAETRDGLSELRRLLDKDKLPSPAREKMLKDLDRLLLP